MQRQCEVFGGLCEAINRRFADSRTRDELLNQLDVSTPAFIEEVSAMISALIEPPISSDGRWIYLRIPIQDTPASEIRNYVLPLVNELLSRSLADGWWWLHKGDPSGRAIRLRVAVAPGKTAEAEAAVRSWLSETGRQSITILRYEPELHLFGGRIGLDLAHAHFCRDSRFLAGWMAHRGYQDGPVIPEGLSVALILHMLRAAQFDVFESWDLFERVLSKRAKRESEACAPRFERIVARIAPGGSEEVFSLYDGEAKRLISEYTNFLAEFSARVNAAYSDGSLGCGVREFFTPIVLFHWNRAAFGWARQKLIASVMAKQLERMSRA